MWIWNGVPTDARDVTGYFYSRGRDRSVGFGVEMLGIGGRSEHQGRLLFVAGDSYEHRVGGRTEMERWTWRHVVLVRKPERVVVYLDGRTEPEIDAYVPHSGANFEELFFGGRCDNVDNFEGRLDEIAVFSRALSGEDVRRLYSADRP